jgi:hypothetical protein
MTRWIENIGRLAVAVVGLAAVLATVPEASMAQSAASSQAVTMVDVENTRNMRFCEVLMINEGNANIYNTTGMSDCPEDEPWAF